MDTNRSLNLLILCALLLLPSTSVRADEAEEILAKMGKAVEPGKDMRAPFEMTITNRAGAKVSLIALARA